MAYPAFTFVTSSHFLFSGEKKSDQGVNFWVYFECDFHDFIEIVHWSGKKVRGPGLSYSVNHCDSGNLEDKNFPLPHLHHSLSQKYRLLVLTPYPGMQSSNDLASLYPFTINSGFG